MDWVNLYALAVNEENASGGTCGDCTHQWCGRRDTCGYALLSRFCPSYTLQGLHDFLLTPRRLASLSKKTPASQAQKWAVKEVGSACAMAAAGLTYVLGGSPAQCANCRNWHRTSSWHDVWPDCGVGASALYRTQCHGGSKAINASRLALKGNGQHVVSLDKAIKTMKDRQNMMSKYKETAMGGLAINVLDEDFAAQSNLIPTLDVTVNYSQC